MRHLPLALLALAAAPALAASPGGAVVGSKHDFSSTGPGPIRSVSEQSPCVACHFSHSGLSSRPDLRARHIPYESTTVNARPGAPTGASRVCLSCHDGTIAVGETRGRFLQMTVDTIPSDRPSNLGTDLRKTHPVSFVPVGDGRTRPPPNGDEVRLDKSGQVQCTSCHDPHSEFGDPAVGKFLVKPSRHSALCLTCHEGLLVNPPASSHGASDAPLPKGQVIPGAATVAEAGCRACHVPHGGDGKGRLLSRPSEEDDALCLPCHSGTVARQDVALELRKPFAHVTPVRGIHDAAEGPGAARPLPEASPGAARHVACVDCHDPHAASDRPAAPGIAAGVLAGVWGIDANGQRVEAVRFEYEVCFKCHGDSANQPRGARSGAPVRAASGANLRLDLASTAASSHPIVAPGRSGGVPSLKAPWTTTSTIACGDCHASESGPGAGGGAPRGPHGSVHPFLLERAYSTADGTPESPSAYALCYKCHDRDVIVDPARRDLSRFPDPTSFSEHGRHLGPAVNAPCSACHTPHGVASETGSPVENAHLVDFDVSIVQPLRGERRYRSAGAAAGSCTLSCHGKEHDATPYAPF